MYPGADHAYAADVFTLSLAAIRDSQSCPLSLPSQLRNNVAAGEPVERGWILFT